MHVYSPPSSSLIFEIFTCEITSSWTVTYWPIRNRELSGICEMKSANELSCSQRAPLADSPETRPISKRTAAVDVRWRRISAKRLGPAVAFAPKTNKAALGWRRPVEAQRSTEPAPTRSTRSTDTCRGPPFESFSAPAAVDPCESRRGCR